MDLCRRIDFRSTRRGKRIAATLALAASLVAAQSLPASAQDIESPAPHPAATNAAQRDSSALRSAIAVTIAGNLFDTVTTIRGVQNGAREVNPLLGQSPARIIVMKSLLVIPQVLAEKRLVDTGHPKAARWLGYAAGGFAAALAVRNIHITK